ncbi:MAG TPA: trypsin-like peptidase domain-containing protein [Ktedonobacteraceae bacterium]|nr:trypsin-like peptidase domain-containing protein [Ktedonobacteraceae bacterium]
MTQATTFSTQSSFPLPDVFSSALTELFSTVQPSIVQVRNGQRGGGTGIIWGTDGRIITNNHVIAGDKATIHVHLVDGRTLDATILHRNPRLDLALLKVTANDLKALPVGDSSNLRVGEWVFAIGHPWGQRWSVTAGIVSTISSVQLANNFTTHYIKSDVLLAPGNSGGPLLNADGHVVGVNAMIFGGDLSVAIPSNVVNTWLASLPGRRNVLGIELQTVELPVSIRQSLQPPRETGLLVVGTQARQGYYSDLLIGDILLNIANEPIRDVATLRNALAQSDVGKNVPLTILRGGNIVTVDVATLTVENAA